MMKALLKRIFTVVAFGAIVSMITPALAQNPHGKSFKDWKAHCNSATGAPAVCILVQDVAFKKSKKRILQFLVRFQPGTNTLIGDIILPLGIYLPFGVTMQIDDGQTFEIPIEICSDGRMRGCRAQFSFDDALLASVKAGGKATITFQDARQTPVPVPVSLAGFTAGIKAIR